MEDAQEWCLQCGTPAPGSLGTHTPSWRSSALVLGATALLALGAAGAAYAALTKTKVRHVVVVQVRRGGDRLSHAAAGRHAHRRPATTPTPKPAVPTTAVKPPKIPLTAPTPKTTHHAHSDEHGAGDDHPDDHSEKHRAEKTRGQQPGRATAPRAPARHQLGRDLQPRRLSRGNVRRPHPDGRRRHLDGLDRTGRPRHRPQDGGWAPDQSERPAEAVRASS